jgi:hypothetical protein
MPNAGAETYSRSSIDFSLCPVIPDQRESPDTD